MRVPCLLAGSLLALLTNCLKQSFSQTFKGIDAYLVMIIYVGEMSHFQKGFKRRRLLLLLFGYGFKFNLKDSTTH